MLSEGVEITQEDVGFLLEALGDRLFELAYNVFFLFRPKVKVEYV